jgi:putative ATP-dependent endonuclease of OLD family
MAACNAWEHFRGKGGHIVVVGGKSKMVEAFAVAQELEIPTYLVFDADGHVEDALRRAKHERDNLALLRMLGYEAESPFPPINRIAATFAMLETEMGSAVRASLGQQWSGINEAACVACGSVGDMKKNALYIAEVVSAAHAGGLSIDPLAQIVQRLEAFTA